ncbi:MAG TPA: efflux RND transporter periplasmic adaptor subunit [Gammaproteobacteria bacterium]
MTRLLASAWGKRLGAAAILVVAIALVAIARNGSAPAAPGGPVAPPGAQGTARDAALTVTAVELGLVELARTVTVNGSVRPWQEVIIAPEVGGYRVAEVRVDVGDVVRKGDTLVQLSTALLEAEVATREAALAQRQAELANAEAALRRGEALAAMDALAEADLDRLRSEALAARARLESAEADLETSRLRLRFTSVTAPDDGVITSRTVTVGEIAQAGVEMLRLLRQGRIEWRGEVPEARLQDLAPGQKVTIVTADGEKIAGRIRVVAPTVSSDTRTGLVYVDLEPNAPVRPGMFARGEIEIGRGPAVVVPLESVVSADGYSHVFVLRPDGTVERRRIELGAVHGAGVEARSGVAAGERIVVKGAGFLKDGDRVNVVASDA